MFNKQTINEISNSLLTNYTQRAIQDKARAEGMEDREFDKGHYQDSYKSHVKIEKRTKGIDMADKKIKETKNLNEMLSKSASVSDWIHDFVHSKNKKFKGKSKKMRIRQALAAYDTKNEENISEISKDLAQRYNDASEKDHNSRFDFMLKQSLKGKEPSKLSNRKLKNRSVGMYRADAKIHKSSDIKVPATEEVVYEKLDDYKIKHVTGKSAYTYFQHPNGSAIEIYHNSNPNTFAATHVDKKGVRHRFYNPDALIKHVESLKEENLEEGKTFKDRRDDVYSKRKDIIRKAIDKNIAFRNSRKKRMVNDNSVSEDNVTADLDNITELKALTKSNLKGYMKKAAKDAADKSEFAGRITHLIRKHFLGVHMNNTADNLRKAAANRLHGISQAAKKLDTKASAVKEKPKKAPVVKSEPSKNSGPKLSPPKMSMPIPKEREKTPAEKVAVKPAKQKTTIVSKTSPLKGVSASKLKPHEKDENNVIRGLNGTTASPKTSPLKGVSAKKIKPQERDENNVISGLNKKPANSNSVKKTVKKAPKVKIAAEETNIDESSPELLNRYLRANLSFSREYGTTSNRRKGFSTALSKVRKLNGLPPLSTDVKVPAKKTN